MHIADRRMCTAPVKGKKWDIRGERAGPAARLGEILLLTLSAGQLGRPGCPPGLASVSFFHGKGTEREKKEGRAGARENKEEHTETPPMTIWGHFLCTWP